MIAIPVASGKASRASVQDSEAVSEKEIAAFKESLAKLPESQLKGRLLDFGEDIFALRKLAAATSEPFKSAEYEVPTLAIVQDYPSIQDMEAAFHEGAWFQAAEMDVYDAIKRGEIVDESVVKVLANDDWPTFVDLKTSFTFPFAHTVEWRKLTLADGRVIDIGSPPAEGVTPRAVRQKGDAAYQLKWPSGNPQRVTFVEAAIQAEMPVDPIILSFATADMGQWKAMGAYRVRLAAMAGSQVRLEVQTKEGRKPELQLDAFMVSAQDKTGRYLANSGLGTGSAYELQQLNKALYQVLDAALAGELPEDITRTAFEQALEASLGGVAEPTFLTLEAEFRGVVERFEILIAAEKTVRQIDISGPTRSFTTTLSPTRSPPDFPISTTAIDHDAMSIIDQAQAANTFELASKSLQDRVKVEIEWLTDSELAATLRYPDVVSNIFFPSRFRTGFFSDEWDIEAFDTRGALVTSDAVFGRSVKDGVLIIDTDEYEGVPARFTGSMTVFTAPDMTFKIVPINDLPEGIQINGNRITLHPEFTHVDFKLFPLDKTGRALVKIADFPQAHENLPYVEHRYYHGQPEAMAIFHKGENQENRITFDLRVPDKDAE